MSLRDELPSKIYNDLEFLLRDFGFVIQENGHSNLVSPNIRIMWSHSSSAIVEFTFYDSLALVCSYWITKNEKDGQYIFYLETPEEKRSSCSREFWFKHLNRYLSKEYLGKEGN